MNHVHKDSKKNSTLDSALLQLTQHQREAVTFFEKGRHLMIEAGAGAGKTHVLSLRVAYAISHPKKTGVSPEKMFLVTFSRMAAAELSDRVVGTLERSGHAMAARQVHVSTIDSFFFSLLESIYPHVWESAKATLWCPKSSLAQTQAPTPLLVQEEWVAESVIQKIEELFQRFPLSPKDFATLADFVLGGAVQRNSHLGTFGQKGNLESLAKLLMSEHFLSLAASPPQLGQASQHPATQALLLELFQLGRTLHNERVFSGQFTYTDVCVFLHNVLCVPFNIKASTPYESSESVQLPIQVNELIVDEYQDTNEMQHDILFACARGAQMTVVGDPKQSIYGFRNAHVGVLLGLKSDPAWKVITLAHNFRTHPSLLSKLNELSSLSLEAPQLDSSESFLGSPFALAALKKRVPPMALESPPSQEHFSADPLLFLLSSSLRDGENLAFLAPDIYWDLVAAHIVYLKQKDEKQGKSTLWSDFVFLTEKNKSVQKAAAELHKRGVPAMTFVSREQAEIGPRTEAFLGSLHALFLANFKDLKETEFFQILTNPLFDQSMTEVLAFFSMPREASALKAFVEGPKLPEVLFPRLSLFQNSLIQCLEQGAHSPLLSWLRFTEFHLQRDAFLSSHLEMALRDALAASLLSWHQSHFQLRAYQDLPTHWQGLQPTLQWQENRDPNPNAVQVMTAHGSKGLEWKHVLFCPNASVHRKSQSSFAVKAEGLVYVKWLPHNETGLSLLKWLSCQTTSGVGAQTEGPISVESEHLDLQKSWEAQFERQRVFYTAVTRPKTTLSFLQTIPRSNAKKGIREKLGSLPQADLQSQMSQDPKLEKLEDRVFAGMACLYFEPGFTSQKEENKKKSIKTFQEPWLGDAVLVTSQRDPHVAWCDATPRHRETLLRELADFQSTQESVPLPIPVLKHEPQLLEESPCSSEFAQSHLKEQTQANPDTDLLDSQSLLESRSPHLRPLKLKQLASAGTRFHSKQELSGPQNPLVRAIWTRSFLKFHEWELWSQNLSRPFAGFLQSPRRHIVDLICCLRGVDFPQEGTFLELDSSKSYAVVVDFKTGRPQKDHETQILDYAELTTAFLETLPVSLEEPLAKDPIVLLSYPKNQVPDWADQWTAVNSESNLSLLRKAPKIRG